DEGDSDSEDADEGMISALGNSESEFSNLGELPVVMPMTKVETKALGNLTEQKRAWQEASLQGLLLIFQYIQGIRR
ncbi:hypothetical protein P7K49_007931, partial [Saguinus oedipus]